MSKILSCLALVLLAGPAFACINDIELPSHEREFRQQYRSPASPPPTPSIKEPAYGPLAGTGGVLLVGALALAFVGGRRKE